MKRYLLAFFKGFIIGTLMIVPGLSGGTIAVILGIYTSLVEAASNIFKDFKRNFLFLLSFILGTLPGFFISSNLMGAILEQHAVIIVFLFAGLILAGLPVVARQAKIKHFNWKHILAILIGTGIVIGITFLPEGNTSVLSGGEIKFIDVLFLIIVGFSVCVSIVLPGISTFHVLYVYGLYEEVTKAIANLDILFLLPLVLTVLIGALMLAKIVNYCLKKFPEIVYCVIIGFVIASVFVLFKEAPQGIEWLWALLLFAFGLIGGYFLMNKIPHKED